MMVDKHDGLGIAETKKKKTNILKMIFNVMVLSQ